MGIQRRAFLVIVLLLSSLASASGPAVRVAGPDPVVADVVSLLAQRMPAATVTRDNVDARLVVAVGAGAFRNEVAQVPVDGASTPVIVGIALTRHAYAQVPPGRHTALYWDPDPLRQLRLSRALLPGAKRAGILLGQADEQLLASLRRESAQLGLSLSIGLIDAPGRLSKQLNHVLADSDFLLGIDDPAVFAPELAKTVLLTTYRHGKPVIGPTAAWVDAGSVASLSTSLDETVAELAAWLPQLLAAGPVPPPRYLTRYRIATNPAVARSLQLSLPSTPALEALVREEESRP